jgi:cytochrome c-type biogenesis protein CcmH/NrfF
MYRGVMQFVIAALCSALVGGSVVLADERAESLDREATNVYQQVFSPFCPGRSLNDCPSGKATDLKNEIRQKLENGESSEQVLNEIFARFGDQYRAVPRFQGVGVLVWLAPIGFLLVGLLIALFLSTSRKKRSSEERSSAGLVSLTEEDRRRIEEELAKLDS